MTGPGEPHADPVRLFRDALPAHIRSQLHDTQRVAAFVTAATGRRWPTAALITECTRGLAGVANAGGVVTYRLQHCAQHNPPVKPTRRRPEWCGTCDPTTRQTLDENQLPSGRRCADCHPLNAKENST